MFAAPLIALLPHQAPHVRAATASAIAGALVEHPDAVVNTIKRLQDVFESNLPPPPDAKESKKNSGAPVISEEEFLAMRAGASDVIAGMGSEDAAEAERETKRQLRVSVAVTLRECAQADVFSVEDGVLDSVLLFIIQKGLCDSDQEVQQSMLAAGTTIVDHYGEHHASTLLDLIEAAMDEAPAADVDMQLHDRRQESTVVLVGGVARFLKDPDKILSIVKKLLDALATPLRVRSKGCRQPPCAPRRLCEDEPQCAPLPRPSPCLLPQWGDLR